ncbi:hypothetical protein HYALB_00012198 [Hymenoscyphus albidus]|uniref:TLC domain-containing protein n=1 Tax=Hymenoscyphus albidus TaxID=595503 RepID=A0A9N9Q1D0_9HELO|nr:hypothetical protein HYALB_00012198 [Hymenoscyphus albidus]
MTGFSVSYHEYQVLDLKRLFGPEILNLPGIIPHLPLVFFSALFYQFVYTIIGPWLLHFKPRNPNVPSTELSRFYWNSNTVSIAQSIINSALAVYVLLHAEFREGLTAQERILGYHSETAAALAVSTGYFCFHLVNVWIHKKSEGNFMFAHSVCALCAVCLGFRPLSLHYNAHLMIWELPNIFLNIQRQLDSAGLKSALTPKVNRLILLATYIVVRLGTGSLTLWWMASDMLATL